REVGWRTFFTTRGSVRQCLATALLGRATASHGKLVFPPGTLRLVAYAWQTILSRGLSCFYSHDTENVKMSTTRLSRNSAAQTTSGANRTHFRNSRPLITGLKCRCGCGQRITRGVGPPLCGSGRMNGSYPMA